MGKVAATKMVSPLTIKNAELVDELRITMKEFCMMFENQPLVFGNKP